MAIEKSYLTPFGATWESAYHRIFRLEITDKTQLVMLIATYVDQTARDADAEPAPMRTYLTTYDPATNLDVYTFGYNWLATHPDFNGGIQK